MEVIAVGVNLSVTKPGTYRIDGFILDDSGKEIGYEKVEERLNPGNHTLSLEFSPSDFIILEEVSRVRLVDLVLTSDGEELENRDLAWTSEEMDPLAFRAVPGSGEAMASQESVVPAGSDSNLPLPAAEGAVLRRENGTVVIS
jgi:hypothetical protein